MNQDQAIQYTYRKTGVSQTLSIEEYEAVIKTPNSDAAINALKKVQIAMIADVRELTED